jgi:hypothetical protein
MERLDDIEYNDAFEDAFNSGFIDSMEAFDDTERNEDTSLEAPPSSPHKPSPSLGAVPPG